MMTRVLSAICLVLGAAVVAASIGGIAGGSFEVSVVLGLGAMLLMLGWVLRK
jgi:hypothetical protein